MGDRVTELARAIADLYATFAPYRAHRRVVGCPCCVTREEEDRLSDHRLRDVPAEALESFAFSALNTWGTLTDFKHFLPRILELKATGALHVDLQTLYGKLVRDEDVPWPDAERRALDRFTRALFVDVLQGAATWRSGPLDVIESAGVAQMDVRALLDEAFRDIDLIRATYLADIVMRQAEALGAGQPKWIWWRGANNRVLQEWLLSGQAYAVLERAFEASPSHPESGEWASACDVLEALGGRAPLQVSAPFDSTRA